MYRKLLIALTLFLGPATGAHADFYLGAKAGPMLVDINGADDPTNAALTLGYEFGVLVGDVGLEAEFARTVSEGKVAGDDLEVESNGFYATFVTAGPVYFKVRAGVVDNEVTVGNDSDTDSGTAVGAGFGVSAGIVRFEIEYTRLDSDLDFITLGLQF